LGLDEAGAAGSECEREGRADKRGTPHGRAILQFGS
jgi:hypothetical protein